MRARERKPVTKTQACLIAGYLAIALARQVARDIRTIIRWAEDFAVDEIHR